jgi:cytidine diphosphoramidate kinase
MVTWIIGLSAAGKTTLAKKVVERLREKNNNVILLDGDVLREVFGGDADHTVEGRAINAKRLSHLSKLLADQGIHVVAAVLSIFPEWQQWNRDNISDYCQVYVNVPLEVLLKREIKGLYAGALKGSIKNVVGIDIDFPEPVDNDLVLDNSIDKNSFSDFVDKIFAIPQIQMLEE